MSAFWHGFYPGYYMTFFGYALVGEITKDFYKSWILFESVPYVIRKAIAYLFTQLMFGYFGVTFMLLTTEKNGQFLQITNYVGVIVLITVLVLSRALGLV